MRWMPLVVLLAACSDTGGDTPGTDSGTAILAPTDTAPPLDSAPGDTAVPGDTGDTGEPVAPTVWFYDGDGDGFGGPTYSVTAVDAPGGYVANAEDCDDSDATVFPAAPELCDGLDNDCDGQADEEAPRWYADIDADGYGDPASWVQACEQEGHVTNDLDCDDADPESHPDALEYCDGVDQDCDGEPDNDADDAEVWFFDFDGDGQGDPEVVLLACEPPDETWVASDEDCDDADDTVFVGAPEYCDSIDHDCDGASDDADPDQVRPWFKDLDGDGYGDPGRSVESCEAPTGYVGNDDDCDDGDSAVRPGAEELCDGVDNDCDGGVDTDATDAETFYADRDGDGYGDAAHTTAACQLPPSHVRDAGDCDDTAAGVNPGATELCDAVDNDCDGDVDDADSDVVGQSLFYADGDGDGFGDPGTVSEQCFQPAGTVTDAQDCDDSAAAVNPAASEVCDGIDNDCDGLSDDADGSVSGQGTWYEDSDGDGHGGAAVVTCEQGALVSSSDDCDDSVATIYPGATEICDTIDNDCDGAVDGDDPDIVGLSTFYVDGDGDGYGDPAGAQETCFQPSGTVLDASDCDDSAASVNPAAVEVCDSIDNDCDAAVDDADPSVTDQQTFWSDLDGDGYGADPVVSCEQGDAVTNADDCDDSASAVNPAATELCDSVDNDCDGAIDDADSSVADQQTYWLDLDGDGYGGAAVVTCEQGDRVTNGDDCDDSAAAVNPAAVEVCDSVDNDCDGQTDDADSSVVGQGTWYDDDDGDGYGGAVVVSCDQGDRVTNADDCDDSAASVNPAAVEVCDSVDNDCDGDTDDADSSVTDQQTFWADLDGDGYGADPVVSCDQGDAVTNADDCDDGAAAVNPAAVEVCDSVDNDCDGLTDDDDSSVTGQNTLYMDDDLDGYGTADLVMLTCATAAEVGGFQDNADDCNDLRDDVYPGAPERCDAQDNDCDGLVDDDDSDLPESEKTLWYLDNDHDGYGTPDTTMTTCITQAGFVTNGDDCADTKPAIHPGATETCDRVDNDCDGAVDDDDSSVTGQTTYWVDGDGDRYGDAEQAACFQGALATQGGDCQDSDPAINPGETETCDGIDNDCDGATDDDDSGVVGQSTWYRDWDRDGFGTAATSAVTCFQPTQYVADDQDCDDGAYAINPNAEEVCDGVDNDCDGDADSDASDRVRWYLDGDDDGYGTTAYLERCEDDDPSTSSKSYVDNNDDCYDSNSKAYPGSSTTSSSHRGDGSYDYDCDNKESKRWTDAYTCESVGISSEVDQVGWVTGTPACGKEGVWASGSDRCSFDEVWSSDVSGKDQQCH